MISFKILLFFFSALDKIFSEKCECLTMILYFFLFPYKKIYIS